MLIGAFLLAATSPSLSSPWLDEDLSRDICAIYALPEQPGYADAGDEEGARRAREFVMDGWQTVLAGNVKGEVRCSGSGSIEELRFSPDRQRAQSYGGWQSTPLSGGWGECYYEKRDGKWRTLACFITAVS